MTRQVFVAALSTIVVLVAAQSVSHLVTIDGVGDIGSMVDLDRSNGLPDLVSTFVLGLAAVGAARLARSGLTVAWVLVGGLAGLTVADLVHRGPHPSSSSGELVIGLVVATVGSLVAVALHMHHRSRLTLIAAVVLIGASLFTSGLDRVDQWFERARPERIAELQIVAKEGFELAGWSLVALALWDQALSRRRRGMQPEPAHEGARNAPSTL